MLIWLSELLGNKKPRARIEDWRRIRQWNGEFRLYGRVYGHPEVADGDAVYTSHVQRMGRSKAETHNTIYTLGRPADSQERT